MWTSGASAPIRVDLTWNEQAFDMLMWLFMMKSWPEIQTHVSHGLTVAWKVRVQNNDGGHWKRGGKMGL